jgi:hypothetical protein
LKRIEGKGIDIVTWVHALVGLAWVSGAIGALVLTALLTFSPAENPAAAWERIAVFQDVASWSSVAMFLVALVYSVATPWGFFKDRGVIVQWVLFLLATATGGPSMSAARAQSTTLVLALTAVEVVVLVAATAVGVHLKLSRRRGRGPAA